VATQALAEAEVLKTLVMMVARMARRVPEVQPEEAVLVATILQAVVYTSQAAEVEAEFSFLDKAQAAALLHLTLGKVVAAEVAGKPPKL
jgi:hypothetical protein